VAAMARIAVLLIAIGREPCAADTAAYCRARLKLKETVIEHLVLQVATKAEAALPAAWLWKNRHVKLVAGGPATLVAGYRQGQDGRAMCVPFHLCFQSGWNPHGANVLLLRNPTAKSGRAIRFWTHCDYFFVVIIKSHRECCRRCSVRKTASRFPY